MPRLGLAWLAVGVALDAAYRRTLPAIFTALTGYIAVLFGAITVAVVWWLVRRTSLSAG